MRILVVGGGGREHALAWKLSYEAEVLCTPGNPGIGADVECLSIGQSDAAGIVQICKERAVDLVVVGPEDPLVDGLADRLREAGLMVYGPNADGAQLEGSKAFSKELMSAAGVPTAGYRTFTDASLAGDYARAAFDEGRAVAVKASGNAVGKGVIVAGDVETALDAIKRMITDREFGEAGSTIVIEERLPGPEFSLLTLVGDHNFVSLPVAQDHKRALDGDLGPNTGGMGTYSPVSWVSADQVAQVEATVVAPVLAELRRRGIGFRGTLFSGLMMDGPVAKCLEFNVRFGDPEIQSLVLRMGSGFASALYAAASGETIVGPEILADAAVTVVIANEGYPTAPRKGSPVTFGEMPEGVKVFHAGTSLRDGALVASGGRVLAVSAAAPTFSEARALAYRGVEAVSISGSFYRSDIGAGELHSTSR